MTIIRPELSVHTLVENENLKSENLKLKEELLKEKQRLIPKMLCSKRIELKESKGIACTYCMKPLGHEGECE